VSNSFSKSTRFINNYMITTPRLSSSGPGRIFSFLPVENIRSITNSTHSIDLTAGMPDKGGLVR
jgi:hypothetical protein